VIHPFIIFIELLVELLIDPAMVVFFSGILMIVMHSIGQVDKDYIFKSVGFKHTS